jgi:hypothetical protein
MKYYTNSRYPGEKVYDEPVDMLDFIENQVGIKFKEVSSFDIDKRFLQDEAKEELISWFFSDWTENEEEEPEEDRQAIIDDLKYLDGVDRRLGL